MRMKGVDTYTCRRSICLAEGIEDEIQLVFSNPNTRICDTELKSNTLVIQRQKSRTQGDMPFARDFRGCKLYGVANKVRDDLAQSKGIADQLIWNVGVYIIGEVEIVLRRADDQSLQNTKDRLTEGIGHRFHGHTTCFNCENMNSKAIIKREGPTLGDVQYIVND